MTKEFIQWLTEQKYYRVISNIEYWMVWPYFRSQKEWTWEEILRDPMWKGLFKRNK